MVVKFKASFHQLKLDFRVELMNFILIIDLILANFIDDFNFTEVRVQPFTNFL